MPQQSNYLTGLSYETFAALYLCNEHGLKLLDKNFRISGGELDLVMLDPSDDEYIFIEVKFRQNNSHGDPSEFITRSKQQRLVKTALKWFEKKSIDSESVFFRFDVIGITLSNSEYKKRHLSVPQIDWLKNCIDATLFDNI